MPPLRFATCPDAWRHWTLDVRDGIGTLALNVQEDGGIVPGYALKLNSYDLGVDMELADAIQRIRFSRPDVRALIVTSLRDRLFCAGANIFMLGASTHSFKVNFCKYTNETRLALEDLSAESGVKTLCALPGTASGGGYELALACDEILLVDDGSSAVSLPEVPLLGVMPGTGGLTRLIDKRRVRRDHADFVSTTAEGVRGLRAVEWRLVDEVVPRSRFSARVRQRAAELAALGRDLHGESGIDLPALEREESSERIDWGQVRLEIERPRRAATLTVQGPARAEAADPAALRHAGAMAWAIGAWRQLDDAILHLRFNEPEIGVVLLRAEGDPEAVLAVDRGLHEHRADWLVREALLLQKRVLKRIDQTARTFFALVERGSAFAGSLFELVLAADRSWMLDGPDVRIALSLLNAGPLATASGLSRLEARFLAEPDRAAALLDREGWFDAAAARAAGLVTFTPDDIDWVDEIRVAVDERASMSPDALTGMEANLRAAGPETMETRIFGRLSAWQNWIFTRPNATGEKGALTVYGKAGERPQFDPRRT